MFGEVHGEEGTETADGKTQRKKKKTITKFKNYSTIANLQLLIIFLEGLS